MNSRLGLILMFEGDWRRVNAAIKNITAFDSVTGKLMRGDADVTSTYLNTSASTTGNMIVSGIIGDKATMPQGNYRYFVSGTYDGKVRTWYWDILVMPKNITLTAGIDITAEDYDPLVEELTVYEGDHFSKELILPSADFSASAGVLTIDGSDVTATYCSGSTSASGDTLTTHHIGGPADLVAGEYGYYLTGTYNDGDAKSTWYYKLTVLPKQGVL